MASRRRTLVTRWNLDPALLAPMTLEQLFVLVRERDPKGPLPQTREALIERLSRDFLGRRN